MNNGWNNKWQYAMYKGEECLAVGTSDEICKQMKISIKTFQFYRSNWYKINKQKNKNSRRYIIKIN